jgi:hypothetical protein
MEAIYGDGGRTGDWGFIEIGGEREDKHDEWKQNSVKDR